MSDLETWIARGVVGAIVTACVGLFVRMRKLESAARRHEQDRRRS